MSSQDRKSNYKFRENIRRHIAKDKLRRARWTNKSDDAFRKVMRNIDSEHAPGTSARNMKSEDKSRRLFLN